MRLGGASGVSIACSISPSVGRRPERFSLIGSSPSAAECGVLSSACRALALRARPGARWVRRERVWLLDRRALSHDEPARLFSHLFRQRLDPQDQDAEGERQDRHRDRDRSAERVETPALVGRRSRLRQPPATPATTRTRLKAKTKIAMEALQLLHCVGIAAIRLMDGPARRKSRCRRGCRSRRVAPRAANPRSFPLTIRQCRCARR